MRHLIIFCQLFCCGVFAGIGHANKGEAPPQVIGGTDAKLHEFPWQASLRNVTNNWHFCGGSLIAKKWVLTAAHCLTISEEQNDGSIKFISIVPANTIIVYLGSHNYAWIPPLEGEKKYAVEKVLPHKEFGTILETRDLRNDIGLLKLAKEVQFSPVIKPISIADPNESPVGRSVIISGWGRKYLFQFDKRGIANVNFCGHNYIFNKWKDYSNMGLYKTHCGYVGVHPDQKRHMNNIVYVLPLILQKISVQVQPDINCKRFSYYDIVWCIGKTNQGSCHGDSGGPMVQKVGSEWKLFGVTSYGNGLICADVTGSSRYTKTGFYKTWIKDTINSN